MVVRTDKMTYTFNLGPQQTRTFNKPMWSLRLLVSITSNNMSGGKPPVHKARASPVHRVTYKTLGERWCYSMNDTRILRVLPIGANEVLTSVVYSIREQLAIDISSTVFTWLYARLKNFFGAYLLDWKINVDWIDKLLVFGQQLEDRITRNRELNGSWNRTCKPRWGTGHEVKTSRWPFYMTT